MASKIILNATDNVTCPACDNAFALHEGLSHQLIEQYEREFSAQLATERAALTVQIGKEETRKSEKAYAAKLATVTEQIEDVKAAEAMQTRATEKQHVAALAAMTLQVTESQQATKKAATQLAESTVKVATTVREELALEMQSLQAEVAAKDKRLADFQAAELGLRKEKQALEAKQQTMELEVARKMDAARKEITSQALQQASEGFSLKEAEYQKQINDAKKAQEVLSRKLEQGSQQLQGEVLELELEALLQQSYPTDSIDPVGKGIHGADVIQTVRMRTGTACGKIVWEAKRAANWSNNWLPKLKLDLQQAQGDIAVLVTTVFPQDCSGDLVQRDGVWLVRPDLVAGLSAALRTILTEAQRQRAVSTGKEAQVEALFHYITSNQFGQRIRAIVDAHSTMREDLEKEKKAIMRLWKKREGQIAQIEEQAISMCGELQGITPTSLPMLDNIASLDFTLETE